MGKLRVLTAPLDDTRWTSAPPPRPLPPEIRELIVKQLSEVLARAWRRDHPGEAVVDDVEPVP